MASDNDMHDRGSLPVTPVADVAQSRDHTPVSNAVQESTGAAINGGSSGWPPIPYRIPARMNDCTNCFWKSRKAMRSGAVERRVAAVMIDQSSP